MHGLTHFGRRAHSTTKFLGVVLLSAVAWIVAPEGPGQESAGQDATSEAKAGAQETSESPSVRKTMGVLRKGMRKLGSQMADESKDEDSLKIIVGMQEAALAAKSGVPRGASRVGDEKKEEFLSGFRLKMIEFLEALLVMERKLLEGDRDAVVEAFQGLNKLKKEGHDSFKSNW